MTTNKCLQIEKNKMWTSAPKIRLHVLNISYIARFLTWVFEVEEHGLQRSAANQAEKNSHSVDLLEDSDTA